MRMTGKNRRTIMGGNAPSYRGPQQIQTYFNAAHQEIKRKVRGDLLNQPCPFPEDSQRHFLTLWVMGCREGEGVMLEPGKVKWSADSIGYQRTPVLKKREKVLDESGDPVYKMVETKVLQQDGTVQSQIIYRPVTRQKIVYREHIMPRDIPYGEEFIDIVQSLQEQGYGYVLFRRLPFSREPVPEEACSTRTVVNRVCELHLDLFPHGVRALHVRYLRHRYGRDKFGAETLKDHLGWSSTEMAYWYLSGQEIADTMGVSVPW